MSPEQVRAIHEQMEMLEKESAALALKIRALTSVFARAVGEMDTLKPPRGLPCPIPPLSDIPVTWVPPLPRREK